MSGDMIPQAPDINGFASSESGEELQDADASTVSPQMLFKISKKIAQLTKVIYTLNTKNDDLEHELKSNPDPEAKNGDLVEEGVKSRRKKRRSKTPEAGDSETKKELKKARHIMKALEAKMKTMEEEKSKNSKKLCDCDKSGSKTEESNQGSKNGCDINAEQIKSENERLKKENEELCRDKKCVQLELSAIRVEVGYYRKTGVKKHKEDDSSKADDAEKLNNILLRDKSGLEKQVKELKGHLEKFQQHQKETANEEFVVRVKREKQVLQADLDKAEKDLRRLREDMRHLQGELELGKVSHGNEVSKLKASGQEMARENEKVTAEMRRVRSRFEELETKLAEVQLQLADKAKAVTCLKVERDSLNKEVAGLKGDLTKSRDTLKKQREDMDFKLRELQANMDKVIKEDRNKNACSDLKMSQLEKALEEALVERQEILEAAAKEIEHQKTIAIETEQKNMEDFEWKLRELETENRRKIKDMERSMETRLAHSKREYERKKDSDFTKMSIDLRREMEEQIRVDRNNLKSALDAQKASEMDMALAMCMVEKDKEFRNRIKDVNDEKSKLQRDIRKLQRKLDDTPNDLIKTKKEVQAEYEKLLGEEKAKLRNLQDHHDRETEKLKQNLEKQLDQTRLDHQEQLKTLESKLESANSNRFSSMFQMKEEVEAEFSERMEQLRNMYKVEIDDLTHKLDSEKSRARQQETILGDTINLKQKEIDELYAYYTQREEDYETKVNDLLTRLAEQTALAQKLQNELEEYDFYEEDEDGNITEKNPGNSGSQRTSANVGSHDTSQKELHGNLVVPNPPPRRERSDEPSGLGNRISWHEDSPRTTADLSPSKSTQEAPTSSATASGSSSTLPKSFKTQKSSTSEAVNRSRKSTTPTKSLTKMLQLQSPKQKRRSGNSVQSNKKSSCVQQ